MAVTLTTPSLGWCRVKTQIPKPHLRLTRNRVRTCAEPLSGGRWRGWPVTPLGGPPSGLHQGLLGPGRWGEQEAHTTLPARSVKRSDPGSEAPAPGSRSLHSRHRPRSGIEWLPSLTLTSFAVHPAVLPSITHPSSIRPTTHPSPTHPPTTHNPSSLYHPSVHPSSIRPSVHCFLSTSLLCIWLWARVWRGRSIRPGSCPDCPSRQTDTRCHSMGDAGRGRRP